MPLNPPDPNVRAVYDDWTEPGDELSQGDIDTAMDDIANLTQAEVAKVLAQYQHWLGIWQRWARTLIRHKDKLVRFGSSQERRHLHDELNALRVGIPTLEKNYVCRECRAPFGKLHKMDCSTGRRLTP